MSSSLAQRGLRCLNFVLTGQVRSGTGMVPAALAAAGRAVCHVDLLHPDLKTRRACHEAYFGAEADTLDDDPCAPWYVHGVSPPHQYLGHRVFDNPRGGECVIGCRVLYPQVHGLELYDLFEERCREGDFCLVHVHRNPVACYVSARQAERGPALGHLPLPVQVDAATLTEFVRGHTAVESKVRASCGDRLELNYLDLFSDFDRSLRRVFEFLELPAPPKISCGTCRPPNLRLRERIGNWSSLRARVPADVRAHLDAQDLY